MSEPAPHTVIGPYKLRRKVGKGSFATVWVAEQQLVNRNVAVKIIDRSQMTTEDAQTRFVRELNLIKQMDHPFITKLFDVIEDEKFTYLVMEYAENGNLLNFVNSHGRLPEPQARRYFSQLISALEYLHNVRFVAHRDLKAENVLLDRYNNIRLIDFGLSNIFTEDDPNLKTACGSPAYASPEMVRGRQYTKAADVWSSGILLYAMVAGCLPFDDDNMQRLLQKIAFTEPRYPSFLSPQLVDLLTKILQKVPTERYSIEKIKTHPWFSQSEYVELYRLNFQGDEQWLVSGIDREIIGRIASYGVDTKGLTESIICGDYNEKTSLYRLFRRDQITEKIRELMQKMNSTGAQQTGIRTPSPSQTTTTSVPRALPVPSRNTPRGVVTNPIQRRLSRPNVPTAASPTPRALPPRRPSDVNKDAIPKPGVGQVIRRGRANSSIMKS